MKLIWKLLLTLAAAMGIAAAFLGAWYQGLFLPGWIEWKNCTVTESDNPGLPDILELKQKTLSVYEDNRLLWQTEKNLRVQDFLWCDIDHDDTPELLVLCWRIGRYGNSRPFWGDREDREWSQHIYIYEWKEQTMSPSWMASDIGMDLVQWEFDTKRRLILTDLNGRVSQWDWISFGLSVLEEKTETETEKETVSYEDIRVKGTSSENYQTSTETEISSKESQINRVTWIAAGDNLIHSSIIYCGERDGGDYSYLYEPIRSLIQEADVASVNQETVFVDDPAKYSSFPFFGTPAAVGEALAEAGFDVASCATNHALDKQMYGIDVTCSLFQELGITRVGTQSREERDYIPYQILEKNGIRIALLSYTFGVNGQPMPKEQPYAVHTFGDEKQVRSDLTEAREASDLVMVFAHWGTEYAGEPDEFQLQWSDILLECGVDVVIGSHPHVLQKYEIRERKDGHTMLVYYSLGNLVSAQTDLPCLLGGLAAFTVEKEGDQCRITNWDLIPIVTHETRKQYSVVYPLTEYTEEMAAEHQAGLTLDDLDELWKKVSCTDEREY